LLLERLTDTAEKLAAWLPRSGGELESVIETQNNVRCPDPQTDTVGGTHVKRSQIRQVTIDISGVDKGDSIKEFVQGKTKFAVEHEHGVPAKRCAQCIQGAQFVLVEPANRSAASGKESFAGNHFLATDTFSHSRERYK